MLPRQTNDPEARGRGLLSHWWVQLELGRCRGARNRDDGFAMGDASADAPKIVWVQGAAAKAQCDSTHPVCSLAARAVNSRARQQVTTDATAHTSSVRIRRTMPVAGVAI